MVANKIGYNYVSRPHAMTITESMSASNLITQVLPLHERTIALPSHPPSLPPPPASAPIQSQQTVALLGFNHDRQLLTSRTLLSAYYTGYG